MGGRNPVVQPSLLSPKVPRAEFRIGNVQFRTQVLDVGWGVPHRSPATPKVHSWTYLKNKTKQTFVWNTVTEKGLRERKREAISHLSFPTWLQWWYLGQTKARRFFQISHLGARPKGLGPSPSASAGALAGSWFRSRGASTWTGAHKWCWVAGHDLTCCVTTPSLNLPFNSLFPMNYLKYSYIMCVCGVK